MTTRILNRGLSYSIGDGVLASELNNFVTDSETNWQRGYDAGDEIIDAVDELAGATWSDAGTDILMHVRTGAPALLGVGADDGRLRGSPIRATWDVDDQVIMDLGTGFPPVDVRAKAGDLFVKRDSLFAYNGTSWYEVSVGQPTYDTPATGSPGESSDFFCWTASSWDGAGGVDRAWCARAEIELDSISGDEWALVWYHRPGAGPDTEFMRFSNGSHLVFTDADLAVNDASTKELTAENIGAGNFRWRVKADFDTADLGALVTEPQTEAASGGSPILSSNGIMNTVRFWDGASSHDYRAGWVTIGAADLDPGPALAGTRFVIQEPGSGLVDGGIEISWATDGSVFSITSEGVENKDGITSKPSLDATRGSPLDSPIVQALGKSFDGADSLPRGIGMRANVTSDVDVGADEYEGLLGLMDAEDVAGFTAYLSMRRASGGDRQIILEQTDPLFGLDSASDEEILFQNVGAGDLTGVFFGGKAASPPIPVTPAGVGVEVRGPGLLADGGTTIRQGAGIWAGGESWDGAASKQRGVGLFPLILADAAGPDLYGAALAFGDLRDDDFPAAPLIILTAHDGSLAVVKMLNDVEGLSVLDLEPVSEADGGTPTLDGPALTWAGSTWDGADSDGRKFDSHLAVTAPASGADEWNLRWRASDASGVWGEFRSTGELSLEQTIALGGALTDGYSAVLRQAPEYDGGFAVARHSYIEMQNPSLLTGATITSAAVLELDAALGTHAATTAIDKTVNAVLGTLQVHLPGGTVGHIPIYAT